MAMDKPSEVLRRRHSKVCEVLNISDTTFRSLVGRLFSDGLIDANTKASILRKLGHEGADKLMDILEMKVDAKPERLEVVLGIMSQEEPLRDVVMSMRTMGNLQPSTVPPAANPRNFTLGIIPPEPSTNPPASPPSRQLNEEDIKRLRQLLNKTIENIYNKLHGATVGALPDLVRMLYEDGLISKDLLSDPNYEGMMKSFLSSLDWDNSVDELEKDCSKFVKALDKIGGPARKAGERISGEWKREVNDKFGFDFNTS